MITRKIIINDFYLSLCKSCLSDVVKRLVRAIMYGQQAMFSNLLVIGGSWSASAAAAAVATVPPPWELQLDSEDNTADLRVTTLLLPVGHRCLANWDPIFIKITRPLDYTDLADHIALIMAHIIACTGHSSHAKDTIIPFYDLTHSYLLEYYS